MEGNVELARAETEQGADGGLHRENPGKPRRFAVPRHERAARQAGALAWFWTLDGMLTEAIDHLERHGVPVEAGPISHEGPRGKGTSVYFRDPDGSLLELLSYA